MRPSRLILPCRGTALDDPMLVQLESGFAIALSQGLHKEPPILDRTPPPSGLDGARAPCFGAGGGERGGGRRQPPSFFASPRTTPFHARYADHLELAAHQSAVQHPPLPRTSTAVILVNPVSSRRGRDRQHPWCVTAAAAAALCTPSPHLGPTDRRGGRETAVAGGGGAILDL